MITESCKDWGECDGLLIEVTVKWLFQYTRPPVWHLKPMYYYDEKATKYKNCPPGRMHKIAQQFNFISVVDFLIEVPMEFKLRQ